MMIRPAHDAVSRALTALCPGWAIVHDRPKMPSRPNGVPRLRVRRIDAPETGNWHTITVSDEIDRVIAQDIAHYLDRGGFK